MCFCLLTAWAKAPVEGVDFRGVDIQYKMMDSAEACQKACDENDKCQFYTYTTENFVNLIYRYSIFRPALSLKQTDKTNQKAVFEFVLQAPLLPEAQHHHPCSS